MTPDTAFILKRYAIVTAITILALWVIGYLLATFAGFSVGSGASVVVAIAPAMYAGQAYARRTGTMPDTGLMWRLAAVFVVINLAIGIAMTAIALTLLGELGDFMAIFKAAGAGLVVFFLVVFVLYWLTGRFFFGMGAKSELKAIERRAGQ